MLPVIPGVIDWVRDPGGAVPDGERPRAPRIPPDEDETPRRVVAVERVPASRAPVTTRSPRGATATTCPVTYVSRDEAQAFCAAPACGCRREDEWEAAARGGDDRLWPWGDELPDASRAMFAPGIGEPGAGRAAARRRVAVRGARPGRQRAASGRRTARVRGGSYLQRPGRAALLAPPADAPGARDHYVGFRVVARRAGAAASTGSTSPAASTRSAATPRRAAAASSSTSSTRVRALADAGHERAVRARSSPTTGARRAAALARAATTTRSRSSTGTRRRPSARGPAAACRPRPSGRRPRAAPTGARYPWGDEEDASRAAIGARPEARDDRAGRLASRRREPVRSAGHGRQRLGVDGDDVPAGRARAARRLVREPGPRLGALRDAQPQPARAPPGAHRLPRRERSAHDRRRGSPARPDARARRGREPDRRHRRGGAAVRAAARGDRHGGRAARRRLPGDADRGRRGCAAASPGRRSCSTAHLDTVPIPHDAAADRGRLGLRPRLGRHEGRVRGCALEAVRVLAERRRSRASS